ncbi:MAG: spermidine/putrescine ABC transporter substrate-binding protein [Alphaproteobacteria bacterium]|nr:spermidine/putrescine ABC transporter substrate-binding protein [Alphaproteobacteria bacterium]
MARFSGVSRRGLLAAFGGAAIGLSLGGCSRKELETLNFYTWDTYIGKTTIADFEATTGADVRASYFANGDELFAKLKAGNRGYDVIVPADEVVTRMVASNLLQPLDLAKIPNIKNIDPRFLDQAYDPKNAHSVPYTWLVQGIGYRKSKVDGVPDSWRWLFDSDRYAGRIALHSEAADIIRLGAKYLTGQMANVDQALCDRVRDMLIRQKPRIKAFHDDNGQDLLLAGDVDLVLEYNGDIAQAMTEDPDIGFVVPGEGSMLNADMLAIPTNAPNPELAHRFIDFLLDARVGKGISETILYPTPNAAAKALMPADYRDNPVIFPPADVLAKCEWGRFQGPEAIRMYETAFTQVRAA